LPLFDVRFGGLSHGVIIETAAPRRKRNACIACMRQANGGLDPEGRGLSPGRGRLAFRKWDRRPPGQADFQMVLLDAFV
jgi:hypothetical protein